MTDPEGSSMPSAELLSFADAIAESETHRKRHLLLGNGFSIACRPDIFAYNALFERADFTAAGSLAREAFAALETTDFEVVMRVLRDAARILRRMEPGSQLAEEFSRTVESLRNVLVSTIAGQHPDRPGDVSENAYRACRRFLSH